MATDEDDLEPLDDLDEDEPSSLVQRLRSKIKDLRRQLSCAFEDGKASGRVEVQRDHAWKTTGIPERVRALIGDVDPRAPDALAAKVGELQADGLRWGDEAAAITATVEQEARSATLDRMSSLAAGGSVVDVEDDKAAKLKARIDSGQDVTDAELAWFLEHVEGAADATRRPSGEGGSHDRLMTASPTP